MAAAELDTVRRLQLPMVVVVYDDNAYGAEVHHSPTRTPRHSDFPGDDIAAIGSRLRIRRGAVRRAADLAGVHNAGGLPQAPPPGGREDRLATRLLVVEEAFRGH